MKVYEYNFNTQKKELNMNDKIRASVLKSAIFLGITIHHAFAMNAQN